MSDTQTPTKLQKLIELFPDKELTVYEGFDDAIIGFTPECVVVYDFGKILDSLIEGGMEKDEAFEWFRENFMNSDIEGLPVFINLL